MKIERSLTGALKALALTTSLACFLVAAGCKGEGGHARGLFSGYVMEKTEEEVTGKVGKPDSVDNANPNTPKWIYKKKTFDPDNFNQVDGETILIFQKDPATGKLKVSQVIFG